MALSEKLFALRKKSGLSQEQLAEQINVSRQAISKWESGQSVPESDKLLAISQYFNVTLDYLMKEDIPSSNGREDSPMQSPERTKWLLGIIICIGGVACLLIWGLLSILNPTVSDQLSDASVIHIDGNGIFLILSVIAVVVGAVLLLKNTKKK